jgi:hypothetical protein
MQPHLRTATRFFLPMVLAGCAADEPPDVGAITQAVELEALPDVVVTGLDYVGGTFHCTVKNVGQAATPAGTDIGVAYLVDGTYRTWGSVHLSLGAGQAIFIGTDGGSYSIPPGAHTIRAFVDDINRFPESDEANNQLSRLITVPGADLTPPGIVPLAPLGTLPAGTRSTLMRVRTDEAARCRWGTSPGTPFAALPQEFTFTGRFSHSTTLDGLADGQSYVRYVRCIDWSGNASTTATAVAFSVAAGSVAPIVWHDDIQSAGSPWGFDGLATEHPIGIPVVPADASGANLSRVANPLAGGGFALRHFATFDDGGSRAQAGLYGFANSAFSAQAKSAEGVWVAQEWYFPQAISAGGDDAAWMNLWDWHSTEAGGGNRWHTSPGLMLAEDGSMRVKWEWGGPANAINPRTGLSSVAMPIGRWFDVEMHYTWTAGKTTLSLWIDGVLALEQSGVQTRAPSHTNVETYMKFYGSRNGGTPWTPVQSLKYTRNVRIAGSRIWH